VPEQRQRIHRVGGRRPVQVHSGDSKERMVADGQPDHLQPVRRRSLDLLLQRRAMRRHKQDEIKLERVAHTFSGDQVSEVNRIKAPTQDP